MAAKGAELARKLPRDGSELRLARRIIPAKAFRYRSRGATHAVVRIRLWSGRTGYRGHMKHRLNLPNCIPAARLAAAIFLGAASAATFAPVPVQAATSVNIIYGYVQHVSSTNIKVYDVKQKDSIAFEIFPKFDQIFSDDGKTTYQMKDIKPGAFVKIYYDQKALGMRHADRIFIYHNSNETPSRKE